MSVSFILLLITAIINNYFSLLFLSTSLLYLLEYVQYFDESLGQFLAVIEATFRDFAVQLFFAAEPKP